MCRESATKAKAVSFVVLEAAPFSGISFVEGEHTEHPNKRKQQAKRQKKPLALDLRSINVSSALRTEDIEKLKVASERNSELENLVSLFLNE